MIVKLDFGRFRTTTWREYATRFVSGGVVTLLAGLIADKFGPGVGGIVSRNFPSECVSDRKTPERKEAASGRERG